ncbi:DNA alkylation repair protein [Spiroplasma endosymbiont of Stenodema calcarata]|uniref:DNA alkylation repair protein n=1 Tax=Spiroplasma endosymbiont of Stenodema calcarata TaxID=3139328 RepID=UPI003CCAF3D6
MAELIKNRYNYNSLYELALKIRAVYDLFQVEDFVNTIMNESWDDLGFKARMRQIAIYLGKYLPTDYPQALNVLNKVIDSYPVGFTDFTLMYFPDFVEVYGQNESDWDLSMAALEKYTPYSSSEFAVRPFLINHEERMLEQMIAWSKHENAHVRRLASEGSRPQLPWGQALISFKKNPLPILPILEELKNDSSLYVRKSVANSLNDISKTHPNLVAKIAKDWYGKSKHTDWIIKHGCRTLLKKGNQDVLGIFGLADVNCVKIEDFTLADGAIIIGKEITFSFKIAAKEATKVRLEYGIDYVKANGKHNRKIFQISELSLKKNEKKTYIKKHSFADLTTRKHYTGTHLITLIMNGTEQSTLNFEVLAIK